MTYMSLVKIINTLQIMKKIPTRRKKGKGNKIYGRKLFNKN